MLALAENVAANGAAFFFNSPVAAITRILKGFMVQTPFGEYRRYILINCAGLYSDKISEMAGVPGYHIYPYRGEYYILDKKVADKLPILAYPVPKSGIGRTVEFAQSQ